jgi:hypothetical protein
MIILLMIFGNVLFYNNKKNVWALINQKPKWCDLRKTRGRPEARNQPVWLSVFGCIYYVTVVIYHLVIKSAVVIFICVSYYYLYWKRYFVEAEVCVWYCGSCCGCGFEKSCFIKSTFNWGWFEKIDVWLKLWLKLRLKKSSLICLVNNAFEIEVIK